MKDTGPVLQVAILAMPESTASTLYGMCDLLASAGRDWPALIEGRAAESRINPWVVSADGRRMALPNGLSVEPAFAIADAPRPDVIAIPDLAVMPGEDLSGRYLAERDWIRALYADGVTLATACTGGLVLAEAGLLDGHDATVHWAYCEAMARRFPRVRVHPNRALVITGDEQRIVMAGGGTAWHDLALYLVARHLGAEEAMHVARLHLIDWHHLGQLPFAAMSCNRQADDAVISRCQEWVAQHYEEETPVSAMAQMSGLSERSFKRRFQRATGMPPLEYVHTLRIEEAKHLLETTDAPVEAIANEVGYADASFFGRLFRRKVAMTPAQYRRRFGALRRMLEGGPGVSVPAAPPPQPASTRQNTAFR
jgi:transcriptional regulator GlxA family with amidase domain